MFVRWRRRTLVQRSRRAAPDASLCAALVESYRAAAGPRQRVIAHLGCVRESGLHVPTLQDAFWRRASRRLDSLGLPPLVRERLEAALADRVPRPTAAEVQSYIQERLAWGRRL